MITVIFILLVFIGSFMVVTGFYSKEYPIFITGCLVVVLGASIFVINENKQLKKSVWDD